MADPKISVLVPCYNREAYVRQCVTSALSQSFGDIEVVCSDNASTDRTYAILQELAARDARVRLLRNDTNLGPLPNWRRCLEHARGAYVHWLWSDDYLEPFYYERMLARLERAAAALGVSPANYYLEAESRFAPYPFAKPFDVLPGRNVGRAMLSRRPPWSVSPASWLIRTDLVRRNFHDRIPVFSGLDCNRTAIGCDALMIAGSALAADRVTFCADARVVFRRHPSSIAVVTPTWRHYETAKLWFLVRSGEDRGLPRRAWMLARAVRIRAPDLARFILTRREPPEGKE
jgi:glycosyltransferase involved in cell wall biosynthesis